MYISNAVCLSDFTTFRRCDTVLTLCHALLRCVFVSESCAESNNVALGKLDIMRIFRYVAIMYICL